jgi:uncharacterized protein (TIGR04141 family)
MAEKTQNLSIRLLRPDMKPEDAVRKAVQLADWPQFEGAKIATGSLGGKPPSWTDFLALPADHKSQLFQRSAFGLVLLFVDERWFAISFGLGHSKIDPSAIEQDFGLKVVLNTVDHTKLRSADLRTPDANTVSRRSQTSRGSEQNAFDIDPERDIVRGLLGEPKDKSFATKVSGGDALSLRRKVDLNELPDLCSRALKFYGADDYKQQFSWIDQIRHVRDQPLIEKLEANLIAALSQALAIDPPATDDIHLAYPTIYDPDKAAWVRFRGFNLNEIYPDLEISHYCSGLKAKNGVTYQDNYLVNHSVQECDETGQVAGSSWKIRDCLVFETELDDARYVLSGGRWYQIDKDLAKEVQAYFDQIAQVELPEAEAGETEELYNNRLKAANADLLCLDRQLVKPTGASSPIEVCDFLAQDRSFIHVKDKTASSRLSHLFSQGLISAVTFKRDTEFRKTVRGLIAGQANGAAFADVVPKDGADWSPSDFTIVYGVLTNSVAGKVPALPFFSLISFRQAARHLTDELGYKVAFSWIKKAGTGNGKKPQRKKKQA